MEKLVYLVWDRPERDAAELGRTVLDEVAPALLALGPRGLQVNLDDADADVASMVPLPGDELPIRVQISVWLDAHDFRAPYEEIIRTLGIRRAGYLVTESLYSDYGRTEHWPQPRDWPDGTRSPGIITLTVFEPPVGVDDDTFLGHWYGHQSPMSEWMQPRMRYVRNTVVRALTPGAPRYRAIVEEGWPTVEHLTDLQRFFGVDAPDRLGEHIRIMLDSTKRLADPTTLRNFTMSEYLLKS
ncbi:MAG TPA: hypothetical protein VFZ83_07775 [Acidimicrobiia bacterium]|nr:hypothetical protein [Acidimicrobiia bacterium]